MKNIFYICFFLLLTVCAQAQRSVTYVSFFPPQNIAHNEVTLTQIQGESFDISELENFDDRVDYAALPGGLILGSADGAVINITTITLQARYAELPYAVTTLKVDKNAYVKANGQIMRVHIGSFSGSSDTKICNGDYKCSDAILSAYDLRWPLRSPDFPDLTFNMNVADMARISNLAIGNAQGVYEENTHFSNFIPTLVPADNSMTSTATRAMTKEDVLQWRHIRINGTEKCLWYLTINPPTPEQQYEIEGGECQDPPEQCHGGTCQA